MAVTCTEATRTLEALRKTPKGSLSYEQSQQWEKRNSQGKLELLHQWTSPPPIAPEAIDYITERAKRLSLDSSLQHSTAQLEDAGNDVTITSLPVSTPHQSRNTTGLNINTLGFEESSESVIGEFWRELDFQEQSMDDHMMQETADDLRKKRNWFCSELDKIKRTAEEKRKLERERREREARLSRERKEAMEIERKIKIREKIESLAEQYKFHEEVMESKLKSGEEEKREIMRKMSERKQMELQRQMRRCIEQRELAHGTMKQLSAILTSCGYPQLLSKTVLSECKATADSLKAVEVELFTMEQNGTADAKQIDRLQAKLSDYLPKVVDLKATIEEINQRGEKEARQNEELLRQTAEKLEQERKAKEREEEERKRESEVKAETAAVSKAEGSLATTKVSSSDGSGGESKGTVKEESKATELGMPKSMLAVYQDLQEKLSKAAAATESMTSTSDLALKKYRFSLQNAVTSTINAISANSGEDLRGKISRLRRLIRGEPIDVMGKTLSIRNHPAAKMYCCNLLAKKLVMQGEDQVASNHEAAFPISAVAIGISSEFPDVGELILAHFYSTCPVLVPLYIPRSKDMSEVDHMKLQGYKVSSKGTVESEDMFLNRVRGIVRLYAAIIQTPPLPVGTPLPHTHSLEYGWAWLARVLNMEPHPTLTATAIGDFLETAGHALLKKYNKQFKKLLFVLCKEYVPMIEKVTPADQKGPLSRLKQFLEECISSGHIPQPKGYLDDRFWRTRSQGIAVA